MAFDIGLVTEYDDAISILDPEVLSTAKAIKLASNQAVFWNMLAAPMAAITQKKFEIYGRSLTSLSGVIGDGVGGGWLIGGTTGLAMTAAGVNALTVGSVIKVESEVVVVKSVDRTLNTIDVWARGAGGTAAAAHADGVAYTVIGFAGNDTDLKNVESRSEVTNKYINYVQTVFETIDYTQSEMLIGRKGLSTDEITLLKTEAMNRVAIALARSALQGYKDAGAAAVPYMSAGLYAQLTDTSGGTRPVLRYNAGSVAFSETILKNALEDVFEKGNPDTILVSQKYKNIMNSFNQAFIQTPKEDKTAGYSVAKYEFEGKILDIVVDQDCLDTRVAVITKDKCQKGWMDGDVLRFVDEPPTSSREKRGSLQGSVGFILEGVGYDHIDIYGLL